jgi:photosystem II stability/assembly factor-like uncharacterized protein
MKNLADVQSITKLDDGTFAIQCQNGRAMTLTQQELLNDVICDWTVWSLPYQAAGYKELPTHTVSGIASDGEALYAFTSAFLSISKDAGKTWTNKSVGDGLPPGISSISASPQILSLIGRSDAVFSFDQGQTFVKGTVQGESIATAVVEGNSILARTKSQQIALSVDKGQSWKILQNVPEHAEFFLGNGSIYLAQRTYSTSVLLKSSDAGESWVSIAPPTAEVDASRFYLPFNRMAIQGHTIAVAPSSYNPEGTLFDNNQSTGVWISDDDGQNWRQIIPSLGYENFYHILEGLKFSGQKLFGFINWTPVTGASSRLVYECAAPFENCKTWDLFENRVVYNQAKDGISANDVATFGNKLFVADRFEGLYRVENGSTDFTNLGEYARTHRTIVPTSFHKNGSKLLVADGRQLYTFAEQGADFQAIPTSLGRGAFFAVNGSQIVGEDENRKVIQSSDGGATWVDCSPFPDTRKTRGLLAAAGGIWNLRSNGDLFLLQKDSCNWQRIAKPEGYVFKIVAEGNRVYILARNDVFFTDNMGLTWQSLVKFDFYPEAIAVGNGKLWVSSDPSSNNSKLYEFDPASKSLKQNSLHVPRIDGISQSANGKTIAVRSREEGMWVSEDGGSSWDRYGMNEGVIGYVESIFVDGRTVYFGNPRAGLHAIHPTTRMNAR